MTRRSVPARRRRIALDDFGAGVTALTNLWTFPLDIVKLDQSLTASLNSPRPKGHTARTRLQAIIDLCHAHALVVTAERVESHEQADVLRRVGCDFGQGWYYGRPGPTISDRSSMLKVQGCASRDS